MVGIKNTFPLYLRITDKIRKQITSGSISVNEKLPSQNELAKRFKTTVMTIRQSLKILEEENLIKTKHGSGMFVINPYIKEDDFQISGFSNEMGDSSLRIDTVLISKDLETDNHKACRALDLISGTKLCMLERLRLIEGNPIVFQKSYLPPWLNHIVKGFTLEKSLYDQLNERSNQKVTTTREILKAIIISKEEAKHLEKKDGSPGLLSLRISQNQNGLPVVYDEAIISGDQFVILTDRFGKYATYHFNLINHKTKNIFDLLLEEE
jgi:GntR family transcriptional regulator